MRSEFFEKKKVVTWISSSKNQINMWKLHIHHTSFVCYTFISFVTFLIINFSNYFLLCTHYFKILLHVYLICTRNHFTLFDSLNFISITSDFIKSIERSSAKQNRNRHCFMTCDSQCIVNVKKKWRCFNNEKRNMSKSMLEKTLKQKIKNHLCEKHKNCIARQVIIIYFMRKFDCKHSYWYFFKSLSKNVIVNVLTTKHSFKKKIAISIINILSLFKFSTLII